MATTKKSDAQIQRQVLDEMRWDTRVRETEVGVEVKDGVVTLVGTVDSWGKRVAAAEAAHRVAGVLDVANNLVVQLLGAGKRSDTDIAQAVRYALIWDVFVPEQKITSTVSSGLVTLEGMVDYYVQKQDAERAVKNLAGVIGVVNRIEVRSQVMSEDVREAIEEALERHASREASRIGVGVDEGKVTLTGLVDSWVERDAIVGAARSTQGVRAVEDKLQIRS